VELAVVAVAILSVASACTADPESPSTESTVTTAARVTPETTRTTQEATEGGVLTGVGVDAESKVISVGLLADQTGLFSSLEGDIVAAQSVYWDVVNDSGGIGGWMVKYIIEDTSSNIDQHVEKYEQIRDEVAAISLSSGSTANIESLVRYKEDSMLVIPLSWYSGWSIPSIDGGVILEQNTNYCLEAMNILDFVNGMGGRTIALATFGDAYGLDAAAGVKKAIEFYDMDLVYDGMAEVVPGVDVTPVIRGIVDSRADWTFLATNPSLGAEILAGAARSGYEGLFVGSVPSYDSRLLDQPAAELYGTVYYRSAYTVAWGEAVEGNNAMMAAVSAVAPDRRPSDVYIAGWNGALSMHRVLAEAVDSGDLTRSGIVSAANSIAELDFGGAAPTQSYTGSPNDYVQRALAIYKPDLDLYLAAGGANQTLSQSNATTGSVLIKDFFIGESAQQYEFSSPCFVG
jgi:ABC-type branched-subunit amino acid transport system substrate-binding protein